jgi:hypothetical protein
MIPSQSHEPPARTAILNLSTTTRLLVVKQYGKHRFTTLKRLSVEPLNQKI